MNQLLHKNIRWIGWLWLWVLAISIEAHEPTNRKGKTPVRRHTVKAVAVKPAVAPAAIVLNQMASLDDLDRALEQAISDVGQQTITTVAPTQTAAEDRSSADNLFTQLDREGRFVKQMSPDLIVQFPIGVTKQVGNSRVDVGFLKATVYPSYAELTAFVRMRIPTPNSRTGEKERIIFFGADKIKFSYTGGIVGEARLVLLGDVNIPIGKTTLFLRGGLDIQTGAAADLTYATLDCDGFREVAIAGDLIFSRDQLVPVNSTGQVESSGQVTAEIRTVATSFDDLVVSINLSPFAVRGYEKYAFILQDAVFDFSDYRNAPNAQFPQNYLTENIPSSNPAAWRGVYIKEFSVLLPPEFKKRSSNARVSLSATDVIIDANGFTGLVSANNILPIDQGTASGWAFSVDRFTLQFKTNSLIGGGFGGRLTLPVSEIANSSDASKAIKYNALISRGGEYLISVSSANEVDFNIWHAQARLYPNSTVELAVRNGQFRPRAILNGQLGIFLNKDGTKTDSAQASHSFSGIVFNDLVLQTEAPYFSAAYFGYRNTSTAGKFPVTISEIAVTTLTSSNNDNFAFIKFGGNVNLMEGGVGGSMGIRVRGKFYNDEGLQRWKFDGLEIDEICVESNTSAFYFKGCLEFFRGDPVFGDGYGGQIALTVKKPNTIGVEARGQFGIAPDGTRYWYVDAKATGLNIPLATPVNLDAIGGGVFRRMRPVNDTNTYQTASQKTTGIKYVVDPNISMGFRAVVGLKAKGGSFIGSAGFEIIINNHGGINSIGLFGEGEVTASVTGLNDLGNNLTGKLRKLAKNAEYFNDTKVGAALSQTKLIAKANTEFAEGATLNASGKISFRFGLLFDFANNVIHGDAEVFANIGGVITGRGPNYRAGWMVMHFDPNKWYIHVGSPTDRLGVRIGYNNIGVQTGSYLMLGQEIPPFPPLPPQMVSLLSSSERQEIETARAQLKTDANSSDASKGFAFGADMSLSTGDFQFVIFYANFGAGMGIDVMLSKNNPSCTGMNGWYARGRVYAYLQGDIGIRVKLGFVKKSVSIFRGAAGVMMDAGLPNPTWFRGSVAGRYSVLGGLVQGSFNLDVSLGTRCGV